VATLDRQEGPAVNTSISTVTVTPHEGACGATITGVRLAEIDEVAFSQVLAAWHSYGVAVFPGQHLDEAAHVAFTRRLGALENTNLRDRDSEKRPTTLTLANINRRGELVTDPEHKLNRFLSSNGHWHSDSSFKRISAKASMLAALQVPSEGGETEYADMRAAYDALDDATRQRLDGLFVFHSAAYSQTAAMGSGSPLHPDEEKNLPPVRQPLVRVHEPTARRSLFIGRHAQYIENFDPAEGRALLDRLLETACQPPRVYRHRWSVGDVVLWDNRCMLHRGHPWDFAQPRVMRRTTVAGEPPPGDQNEWAL
jgi:alpha-ketoglutarate-dependent taurine dioxygenase